MWSFKFYTEGQQSTTESTQVPMTFLAAKDWAMDRAQVLEAQRIEISR